MTAYTEIKNSQEFVKYCDKNEYFVDMIWTLYKVIPFTQQDKILKKLINALKFAQDCGDIKCEEFINKMINSIQK